MPTVHFLPLPTPEGSVYPSSYPLGPLSSTSSDVSSHPSSLPITPNLSSESTHTQEAQHTSSQDAQDRARREMPPPPVPPGGKLSKKSSRPSLRHMPSISSVKSILTKSSKASLRSTYANLDEDTGLLPSTGSGLVNPGVVEGLSESTNAGGTGARPARRERQSSWKGSISKTLKKISMNRWSSRATSADAGPPEDVALQQVWWTNHYKQQVLERKSFDSAVVYNRPPLEVHFPPITSNLVPDLRRVSVISTGSSIINIHPVEIAPEPINPDGDTSITDTDEQEVSPSVSHKDLGGTGLPTSDSSLFDAPDDETETFNLDVFSPRLPGPPVIRGIVTSVSPISPLELPMSDRELRESYPTPVLPKTGVPTPTDAPRSRFLHTANPAPVDTETIIRSSTSEQSVARACIVPARPHLSNTSNTPSTEKENVSIPSGIRPSISQTLEEGDNDIPSPKTAVPTPRASVFSTFSRNSATIPHSSSFQSFTSSQIRSPLTGLPSPIPGLGSQTTTTTSRTFTLPYIPGLVPANTSARPIILPCPTPPSLINSPKSLVPPIHSPVIGKAANCPSSQNTGYESARRRRSSLRAGLTGPLGALGFTTVSDISSEQAQQPSETENKEHVDTPGTFGLPGEKESLEKGDNPYFGYGSNTFSVYTLFPLPAEGR